MQILLKTLGGIITAILIGFTVIGTVFLIYFSIAFIDWIADDPLDIIDIEGVQKTQSSLWNLCIQDTKRIFDDFNDTIGASYALADMPSEGSKVFMEYCLTNSGDNNN